MGAELRELATHEDHRRVRTSIGDDELCRFVSRELHDRVAQTLTAMLVELENFRNEQLGRRSVIEEIDALEGALREVLSSLRELLHELRGESRVVSEAFTDVVAKLLADFETRTGIQAQLTVGPGWPERVKSVAAVNLCRIISEALTNVRRHSGATHVTVALQPHGPSGVSITVADDGRGFEPDAAGYLGLGVACMRERALLLGASLEMGSRLDAGTTVAVIVPGRTVSAMASRR